MSTNDLSVEPLKVLSLRVTAEADPGALPRVLASIQQLNILPRRVVAEFASDDVLHVRIDLAGISEARLSVMAAKIDQIPTVLRAYWHRA